MALNLVATEKNISSYNLESKSSAPKVFLVLSRKISPTYHHKEISVVKNS